MSLLNKVALVTGGTSGIGAAIAAKLSAECVKVVVVGCDKVTPVPVAKCLEHDKENPFVIIADVTKESHVKNIVNETLKKYGKLDILINSVGIGAKHLSILSRKALNEYDKIMATNMRSIVNITNLFAPHIIASKGNIINICSVAAVIPSTDTGFAYNASKAALDHYTRTVAAELASKGVRVNAVNPGPVRTDIAKNSGITIEQEDAFWKVLKKKTALKRISEPEEVADLVLFLASDKAKGITGASFLIDNGAALIV